MTVPNDKWIPFNRPAIVGDAFDYIRTAIVSNLHLSGDGPYTKKAQALLETHLDVEKILLTSSCTHALEMAALLLDIQPGDEFIVPSFTFVTTASAFVLRGAKPAFIDIRPDTLNLDETQVEKLITPRTKAVAVIHYAGFAAEMDAVMEVANHYQVPVVEDNAHGLFGKYKGQYLGTIGTFGTQSFHETKNIHCGEGGAILINEPEYIERAEIIREKGTDRSRFFRGQVDKYSWADLGSSYLMSELSAAYLYAQLEHYQTIQQKRQMVWERYHRELRDWAEEQGVKTPTVPEGVEQAYHIYFLILPSLEDRNRFIAALKEDGINTVFHYLPLHLSPMGKNFGGQQGDCPITESMSDRLVRLPIFYDLTEEDQAYVIERIRRWRV